MGTRTRRQFIGGLTSTAATTALVACHPRGPWHPGRGLPQLPPNLFSLGVASGDPRHDSVLLWTRLAPDPLGGGGMPEVAVPVRYELAFDDAFAKVVRRGHAWAEPRWGHSVHASVNGLRPDAWYWYRFIVGEEVSPIGRARTAPAPGRGDSLSFLFASCQNFRHGYYTAWEHAPAEETDLIVHLGDYIYEGGMASGGVRQHNSPEVHTLDGYRNRYALYKQDPALQAAHAACPWVVTWDDHEVENNHAGLVPQEVEEQPEFAARRAAAYQAWWEHQPVRMPPPTDEHLRIYRNLDWGRLGRFHVLDTRQYRDNQPCGTNDWGTVCPERDDPARTFLGARQEAWLGRSLKRSRAVWDILANQVIMTALPVAGALHNFDQWDGYTAARSRLFDELRDGRVENPLVLSGDAHAGAVGEVVGQTDEGFTEPVATEFLGNSITSNFGEELWEAAEQLVVDLDHVRWINVRQRGYVRCDATRDAFTAQYRLVDTVLEPSSPISTASAWRVEPGHIGAQQI